MHFFKGSGMLRSTLASQVAERGEEVKGLERHLVGLENEKEALLRARSGFEAEKKRAVNKIQQLRTKMTTISSQQIIFIDRLADQSLVKEVITYGAYSHIIPQPGQSVALRDALVAGGGQHWRVWCKEDIPERLHTKHNRRMTQVFALADEGWSISPDNKVNEPNIFANASNQGKFVGVLKYNLLFLIIQWSFKVNYVYPLSPIYPL